MTFRPLYSAALRTELWEWLIRAYFNE